MILQEIVAKKCIQLAEEGRNVPLSFLERQAREAVLGPDFHAALRQPRLSIIAEIKQASPSKGLISHNFRPTETALQYEQSGASAISVLTERHYFRGNEKDLQAVRKTVNLPVLRKDFMITERQVIESKAIGANAILLIAALLDDKKMKALYRAAQEYHLACLFEAHDETEVRRVVDCGAQIIGINNRDLKTFRVDLSTFERLRPLIPAGCIAVAESGIRSSVDALRLRAAGADAILVGESLMKAENIAQLMLDLKGE